MTIRTAFAVVSLSVFSSLPLIGCGPAYSAADPVVCGDDCGYVPPSSVATTQPTQVLPVGTANHSTNTTPSPPDAGATKPDASEMSDAGNSTTTPSSPSPSPSSSSPTTPASSPPPCACDFPSVFGGLVTKACNETICWKPENAIDYSIWECVGNESASPTFEVCSNPE